MWESLFGGLSDMWEGFKGGAGRAWDNLTTGWSGPQPNMSTPSGPAVGDQLGGGSGVWDKIGQGVGGFAKSMLPTAAGLGSQLLINTMFPGQEGKMKQAPITRESTEASQSRLAGAKQAQSEYAKFADPTHGMSLSDFEMDNLRRNVMQNRAMSGQARGSSLTQKALDDAIAKATYDKGLQRTANMNTAAGNLATLSSGYPQSPYTWNTPDKPNAFAQLFGKFGAPSVAEGVAKMAGTPLPDMWKKPGIEDVLRAMGRG